MKKKTSIFLQHILSSINSIEDYTKGYTKERFFESRKTQDSVIRNIEIIGEATKNIPIDFKEKHKNIPWKEMVRTRDKLLHHYFGIDLKITWDVLKKDLPKLKKQIEEILKSFY